MSSNSTRELLTIGRQPPLTRQDELLGVRVCCVFWLRAVSLNSKFKLNGKLAHAGAPLSVCQSVSDTRMPHCVHYHGTYAIEQNLERRSAVAAEVKW